MQNLNIKNLFSSENLNKINKELKKVAYETPLEKNERYSQLYKANILCKREDLQTVRSYKIRGAFNKINSLSEKKRNEGVVCASAGNHAQGVALSCKILKIYAKIFMPISTTTQKINQVRKFGEEYIEVILIGDTFDDTEKEAIQFCKKNKKVMIHPFDDIKVIQGQATIGVEILNQTQTPIDYLILPIGGGGVASGISSIFKRISPNTKIIGVEPKGAPSMSLAFKENKIVKLKQIDNFIDGAAVKKVGKLTFQLCKQNLHKIITVDEGKVCETLLELYNNEAMVIEPAGALTLAALEHLREKIKGKTVVCLVSGGNNDSARMEEIRERATQYQDVKHFFLIKLPKKGESIKTILKNTLDIEEEIIFFKYEKKDKGDEYAIIGIQLKTKKGLNSLIKRMKELEYYKMHINERETLGESLP